MRVIDFNAGDPKFAHDVAQRREGRHVSACYACGACSARCPVFLADPEFDPRRLIRLVALGQREEVLTGPLIWRCATCFTCQETCPQGVGFTEVIFALKNMAAEAGHAPPQLAAQPGILRDQGRLLEITDFENDKRAKMGLPPLPNRVSLADLFGPPAVTEE